MQLKDFIKTALVEIAQAVKEADIEYEKMGGSINPKDVQSDSPYTFIDESNTKINVKEIKFSLSVTESELSETNKGGGFGISVVSAKLENSRGSSQTSINTIEFSLPLVLPVSTTNRNTRKRKITRI